VSVDLARALVASLDDQALDQLAELLAPRLRDRISPPSSPFVDVAGAAERLRCSRQRVYDLVHAGRLQPRRDGRRLLFAVADLDTYLAASLPRRPSMKESA
jgi:excisionase family DNA binding protein